MSLAHTTVEAWFALGSQQRQLGKLTQAESSYRNALKLNPCHVHSIFALGAVLIDQARAAEAEALLGTAQAHVRDQNLAMELANLLALAQKIQGKTDAALENLAHAQRLDPGRMDFALNRCHMLEDAWRFDEAAAVMKDLVARDPSNPELHRKYNHLLYQLGREEEFLVSYDGAPRTTALQSGKALFLLAVNRGEDAHAVYSDILAREPHNCDAAMGSAVALNQMARHDDATRILEQALARHPHDHNLYRVLAATALQGRDPEKAAVMAHQATALAPDDQLAIALLGTSWRMMGDERDEFINGYDELIRSFDLEPPQGFSNMAAFNVELEAYLVKLHPPTREFLMRTLRGGTQSVGNVFDAGHDLVERLKARIAECVSRYIAELAPDPVHPFRRRRGRAFAFTGSWSSRLSDRGFYVNHVHSKGWISSCYYIGVPKVVEDSTAKQGWIKFGEPGYELGVQMRRAIQPAPGRLVLFPSYMWHGTIPFHDDSPRTTIAFDAVPC